MTPPNDAWDIPDIVEVILDTVAAPLETKEPAVAATAYGDLATLARTCRKFNEPAMARLWRTQTTLYNLLHDLPPHCWTISGQWDSRTGQYTDWRILHEEAAHSSDAWTTVRARAARIRCLRLHGRFHISLFDTLFAADQPLFVNLQETSVPIDLQSFPELFFPPTLRALRLRDSRRAVYNSMRRGLDEGDAEVTAATLRHLATLPELRVLTLQIADAAQLKRVGMLPFRKLEILRFYGTNVDVEQAFLELLPEDHELRAQRREMVAGAGLQTSHRTARREGVNCVKPKMSPAYPPRECYAPRRPLMSIQVGVNRSSSR